MFEKRDDSQLRRARAVCEDADEVLALLRTLADPDRTTALRALHLLDCIFSDQLVVYVEATPLIVPYLLELLTYELPIARELLFFMGSLLGYHDEDDLFRLVPIHKPLVRKPEEQATIAAIEAGRDVFSALLNAPSPELRAAAVWLLTRIGNDPSPLMQRLWIEDDARVRLSLHVALTGAFKQRPAPESPGTLAFDVLRVLTMTYPLDQTMVAALTRILCAPWMPTLHFVSGIPAQLAALRIYHLGRDEPQLLPLLRAASEDYERGPKAHGPDHRWYLDSGSGLQRLLDWVEHGDDTQSFDDVSF